MTPDPDPLAVRIVVHGRVQGVWYRGWTIDEARARRISGWVRNRRDGTVEALLVGPAEAVRAMIEVCRSGPSAARVRGIEEHPASEDELAAASAASFEQRPTL
jgi:acylphosphatase